jgi:Uma2 family endonuclease
VSDSTLERDRTIKQRLYARAGIPVYWIVNLPEQQIEVYTEPAIAGGFHYQQRQDYQLSENLPVAIAGQIIGNLSVRELLP